MNFKVQEEKLYKLASIEESRISGVLSQKLKQKMIDLFSNSKNKGVIVNLYSVNYVDSSALTALLLGYRFSRQHQVFFGITHVSTHVLKVIQVSKLDRVLNIYNSNEEAIEEVLKIGNNQAKCY